MWQGRPSLAMVLQCPRRGRAGSSGVAAAAFGSPGDAGDAGSTSPKCGQPGCQCGWPHQLLTWLAPRRIMRATAFRGLSRELTPFHIDRWERNNLIDPNAYSVAELDTIVDAVRKKFRDKLAADPGFFGQDKGVANRIALTLDEHAAKGTLAAPAGVDANSTAGIMATVDLTILDRNATNEEVEKIARRAAKEHCASVCVYPEHVQIVSRVMKEEGVTDVPPIAVVGFPTVAEPTAEAMAATVKQTRDAIAAGAKEIDMVLPTNFREDKGDYQDHFRYIKAVVEASHDKAIPVKVILETGYLNDRQIAEASVIAKIAGADWVKTSTGFADTAKLAGNKNISQHKGATPHDVALIRRAVGDLSLDDHGNKKPMGVKAAGGVRNRAQAQAVLNAGADRIGASGGLDVRTETENAEDASAPSTQGKAAGGNAY